MTTHRYIWQRKDWPSFSWKVEEVLSPLGKARMAQGRLFQAVKSLGWENLRAPEADALAEEAVTTSAIEGEKINLKSVRSSVARRLGLPTAGLPHPDRHVEGLVDVLQDAVQNHGKALTAARLKGWQAALFPTGRSGLHEIKVGDWRDKPMRVVSGPIGRERVHFEAPPPGPPLAEEMRRFLEWWNASLGSMDGLLRAGLAHFYFVTIHPFEDGNGRVARALTDMALAQDEKSSHRFYSVSALILAERKGYYQVLERCSRADMGVTGWFLWFLERFRSAVEAAEKTVSKTLGAAMFWKKVSGLELSDKQRKVLRKMLESGPGKFEGGLTTRKFVAMTKASRATAFREIADLVEKKILHPRPARGRSRAYDLNWSTA